MSFQIGSHIETIVRTPSRYKRLYSNTRIIICHKGTRPNTKQRVQVHKVMKMHKGPCPDTKALQPRLQVTVISLSERMYKGPLTPINAIQEQVTEIIG